MYGRMRTPPGFFKNTGGPPARGPMSPDVVVILVLVFVTFVFQFFKLTAVIPALLHLSSLVYRGFVWQLVTYAFTGFGPASFWFLLSMLILYWFADDIFRRLGRRKFWTVLITAVTGAAVAAVTIEGVASALGRGFPMAFFLMQGQYVLISIFIAAYGTLFADGTILLFFILPIRASWFLLLEILFAFMGFLNTHDFPGFVGICTAVALSWLMLQPGGPAMGLRNLRLRIRRMVMEARLKRLRKKKNLRVIDKDDQWLN